MAQTLTYKIIENHLVEGNLDSDQDLKIKIDQTLTQDSTGTMAYLQLEAMGIEQVKTYKSVAYIDHNMLQQGFENADDHRYIQTVANKHGVYFSKPGNGICHQVHLERFSVPGQTLLGSDSHTPTCGGMGMLAIGAGGLDVAVAMSGGAYSIKKPKVVKVELLGALNKGVSAKDIILKVLKELTVKGGVGKVIEYVGEGVKTLSVPERATITNMGAELGATTSIFPSDEVTKEFLVAQQRGSDFKLLSADEGAVYDETLIIDLSQLKPLVAMPHSPDNVTEVCQIEGEKIHQVCIGSCTNSSYLDMMKVAKIIKGKQVHQNVSLVIAPGSKQVLKMLASNGALADMLDAGARILETGCGPCIGMGQAPETDAISLRTFNRNFKGRCGTLSAGVYLVSPETAAMSALSGVITNPEALDVSLDIDLPEVFDINDEMIISPTKNYKHAHVKKGPNIKPFPVNIPLETKLRGEILIKVGDHITTDHIMPSNAKLLPFRSNIPHLAEYCLTPCDASFPKRAMDKKGGFILAGENYGQGSSREHAALVPLYLGVKAVIAKSFARIHKDNLINSGILPLTFTNPSDYDAIELGDALVIGNTIEGVKSGALKVFNETQNNIYDLNVELSNEQLDMILVGGKINFIRKDII